ncbi:MAG: integrin alpha [Myxococcota bacterium]|nr:integrin alpha [Myxococcota bacterium]
MMLRPGPALALFFCLSLPACSDEPVDDDDSAPVDDDDSAVADDDDSSVPPEPEWAAGPSESYLSFTGGGEHLGAVMDAGFDLDGDGLPDMAFGTPMDIHESKAELNRGRVYVFFGSSVAAPGDFDVALDADVVIVGDEDEMRVGSVVAGHGDIDGDGLDDLFIGGATQMNSWVFFGSTLSVGGEFLVSQADRVIAAQVPECAHYVGDVDGDGRDELLLANTLNSMSGNVAGRSFLLSGMSLAEATEPLSVFDGWASFPGQGPAQASGCESGPVGDVDLDGFADIMIGTQGNSAGGGPNAGMVSVFSGASLIGRSGVVLLSDADWTFLGEYGDDRLGTDLTAVGDFDGDGRSDFLLTARNNDEGGANSGKSYFYLGETLQPAVPPSIFEADLALLGEAEYDKSGTSVTALGDVDGDGLPDFAIGAPRNDRGGDDAGTVYIVESQGIAAAGGTLVGGGAGGVVSGEEPGARFGSQVVGTGDVDGDGLGDLLVGAPRAVAEGVEGEQRGAIWLFRSPYALQ